MLVKVITVVIELPGYLEPGPVPDLNPTLLLVGGRLAIDFANNPSYPGMPTQNLSWDELIRFLEASRIVSAERGASLLALPGSDPDTAQALLSRAVRLRDALRKAFRDWCFFSGEGDGPAGRGGPWVAVCGNRHKVASFARRHAS